jgi:hypothetical protein
VRLSSIWLLALAFPLQQAPEQPAVRITIQSGLVGNSFERTIYIQKDRKRTEFRNSFGRKDPVETIYGPHLAQIVRCDLGQSFELNLDTSEYTSALYPHHAPTKEEISAPELETPMQTPGNPTMRIEIKTNDTGERKEMCGHIARHVITTRTQTPLEGSHSEPQESVTDGWYIDFDQQVSCDPKRPEGRQGHIYVHVGTGNGKHPTENFEFVRIGKPETGFVLYSLVTSKSLSPLPDGNVSQIKTRVTGFEEEPLDSALFEIPPGFRHVDHIERNPPPSAFASKP